MVEAEHPLGNETASPRKADGQAFFPDQEGTNGYHVESEDTRPILLLDLDGTLVMTTNSRELVNSLREPDFNFWLGDELTFGYRRPNVEEFLMWCKSNFRVYLWTAAHGTYAQQVMERMAKLLKDYQPTIPEEEISTTETAATKDIPQATSLLDVSIEEDSRKISSRRSSRGGEGEEVVVVEEKENTLRIESFSEGILTRSESVENDAPAQISGEFPHPLTHNNEAKNVAYYENEVHHPNESQSRKPSQETPPESEEQKTPQILVEGNGGEVVPEWDVELEGSLGEPLELPVLQIFDKNECDIHWSGGAWVTKNLDHLRERYFPNVPRENFVVIDNDPHTYRLNRDRAIPISTYWGSTYDDELPMIMQFLRDTYLPSSNRALLDLQFWNAKEASESMELY